jgi:hypothetical protein
MVEEHWLEALVANVPGAIYRCALAHDWAMEYISQGIEQITGAEIGATQRASG